MPSADTLSELKQRLMQCEELPSPPGIVEQLLALADDANATMADFAELVAVDVGLSAQILKLANSPIYALRREVATVHQAVTLVGLTATLNNALSLLLMSSMRAYQSNGLDYGHFWRRATGAAAACRQLARNRREPNAESFFMAGLIQDVGMLALDAMEPGIYAELGELQKDHVRLARHERERLGIDHADAGAWLVDEWGLPERYCQSVSASHAPGDRPVDSENASVARCVAMGGRIADIIYGHDQQLCIDRALALGNSGEDLSKDVLGTLIERVTEELVDVGKVFELDLGDAAWLASRCESALGLLETEAAVAPQR